MKYVFYLVLIGLFLYACFMIFHFFIALLKQARNYHIKSVKHADKTAFLQDLKAHAEIGYYQIGEVVINDSGEYEVKVRKDFKK